MVEQQVEFRIASPAMKQKSLPQEEGIEIYRALASDLFPDRPHGGVPRFCRCSQCLEYYGEAH